MAPSPLLLEAAVVRARTAADTPTAVDTRLAAVPVEAFPATDREPEHIQAVGRRSSRGPRKAEGWRKEAVRLPVQASSNRRVGTIRRRKHNRAVGRPRTVNRAAVQQRNLQQVHREAVVATHFHAGARDSWGRPLLGRDLLGLFLHLSGEWGLGILHHQISQECSSNLRQTDLVQCIECRFSYLLCGDGCAWDFR